MPELNGTSTRLVPGAASTSTSSAVPTGAVIVVVRARNQTLRGSAPTRSSDRSAWTSDERTGTLTPADAPGAPPRSASAATITPAPCQRRTGPWRVYGRLRGDEPAEAYSSARVRQGPRGRRRALDGGFDRALPRG